MPTTVLVLDFGSQYTQLIARRIRELGVYSEIRPCTAAPRKEDLSCVRALVLSGGPASVSDKDAPAFDPEWLSLGLPTLGICYGMQLLAHLQGGKLGRGESREYGFATLEVLKNDSLFSAFSCGDHTPVWMSHGDHVEKLPPGYELLAQSPGAPVAAMGSLEKKTYGIQFHPEVIHTARGKEILSAFLFDVAGCRADWTPADFVENEVRRLQETIPARGNVLCALSGGVDSSVAAILVHRAIGSRLHCIFVDNGLLRKNEAHRVMEAFGAGGLGLNIRKVDAQKLFLDALRGIEDPEKKRKIIGQLFIEVFQQEAARISAVTHLVQGTIYPDVIESMSVRGPSATIKSHHNVGGLPDKMNLKLVEPLRELFKDEVRAIGFELKIPAKLLLRQPFPGPGLAVRILGEVTQERLAILREADQIFVEEVKAEGLYKSIWQSFAVLLPVQSVGVMGDGRTYEWTIALRAVYSQDGMTADWCYLPHELLRRVSSRIINEVKGVNRVVLDISSKPPATIEWE